MRFKELQQLLAQLQKEINCPGCEKFYNESEIIIVGAIGNEAYLHMVCSDCDAEAAVTAVLDKHKKNRRHKGLTVRNLEKPLLQEITVDEVLEMHNFIENFEGDFATIFSK